LKTAADVTQWLWKSCFRPVMQRARCKFSFLLVYFQLAN